LCAQDRKQGKGRKDLVKWHQYHDKTWELLEGIEETLALDAFKKEHGNAKENDRLWGLYGRHKHKKGQRTGVSYFYLSKEEEKRKTKETEKLDSAKLRSCGEG